MGTEPELAPEWLRSSGNAAGGSTSLHHKDSSSAQSTQSKYHSGNIKKDGPHYLDRSLSSSSRHGSSNNGSTKPSYSNFSRSPWEKKRESSFRSINPHGDGWGMKEKLLNFPSIPLHSPQFPKGIECIQTSPDRGKEKYLSRNLWDHNSSYLLPSKLTSRAHKDGLSGSQSLISRKRGEQVPRIVGNSHTMNQKAVFEKDFPTLGTGEKQNVSAIKRHLSPGSSYVVQSLPMGHSRFLDGEKWSSALVEVTHALENNSISHSSLTRGVVTAHGSAAVSSATGLNMAEALSIPAVRVHANPQQPDKSQRLEELAIKQSKQLIPMKPSVPKSLGLPISIDKSKQPKPAFRNTETTMVSGGRIKSDSVSASHAGKFLVLKSGREIIPTGAKNGVSNDSNGSVSSDGRLAMALPTPKSSISHLKSTADKKSAQSLVQSRSEFFKLMRKKASSPPSTSTSCSNSNTEKRKGCEGDISSQSLENRCEEKGFLDVGDCCLSSNGSTYPNEEEAAFLRSLGWDENGGEEGGLTEEEINAFYHEYMNGGPSSENAKARNLLQQQMPCQEFTFPTRSSSESEPEA